MKRFLVSALFVCLAAGSVHTALKVFKPVSYMTDGAMTNSRFWSNHRSVTIPTGFRVIPRQLPGPMDVWAGAEPKEFTFSPAFTGETRVIINLLDSHESSPPALDIYVDGEAADRLLVPKGAGRPSNEWKTRGKRSSLTFTLARGESSGENRTITIKNVSGSWVAFENVKMYRVVSIGETALLVAGWIVLLSIVAVRKALVGVTLFFVSSVAVFAGSETAFDTLLILGASLVLSIPLFHDGYFFSHEEFFPFYRVTGTDLAIDTGQFPPRVLPNLANGFGYGWSLFYPPLSYDLTWLIYKTGIPALESVKLFQFLTIFLAGVSMYGFMAKATRNRTVSVVAALLYASAPYRLVDVYIRNAYAESATFVLIPALFYGIHEIVHNKKGKPWPFILAMASLALTHNITALYAVFFGCVFCVFQFRAMLANRRSIPLLLVGGIVAGLISAFYIGPLYEHKANGDYAVFGRFKPSGEMVYSQTTRVAQLFSRAVNFEQSLPLDRSDEEEMPTPLGAHIVLAALLAIFAGRKSNRGFVGPFIVLGFTATIMTTSLFPWKIAPAVFLYIQYPWRLLSFATFFLSAYGALAFSSMDHFRWKRALTMIMAVAVIGYVYPFITADYRPDFTNLSIRETELNQGFIIGTSGGEYLPSVLYSNKRYIHERDEHVRIIKGSADAGYPIRWGTNVSFDLKVDDGMVEAEAPLIYYIGYAATLREPGGAVTSLPVGISPNGFVSVSADKSGEVTIRYENSPLGAICNWITIAGLALLMWNIVSGGREKAEPGG